MRFAGAMIVGCLMVGSAGCGAESEEQSAADTYNSVVEAVQDEKYEEACERITRKTREDLSRAGQVLQTGEDCGETLKAVIAQVGTDAEGLKRVAASDVTLDSATTATVRGARMSKQDGEWRLEGDLDFVRPFLSRDNSTR